IAAHIGSAITNARVHEEERRRAEALAEIDRAKTTFFSNVSHEFRTPLTLMLGPLEEALAGADLTPARREPLEVAHRNALRVLKLVNSLLDFSRVESGRMEARYQPTDLAAFTAELASTFRSLCERAGLRLIVDCSPLPEAVFVDPEMWERIVLNLLSNAFKYTFEGEIAVGVRAAEGHVEFSVRDTGVGIAEDQFSEIFKRFHRAPAQRGRSFEGSGIGLSLVQELVRLHGGEISVQSREHGGTSFLIMLQFGAAHLPGDKVLAESSRTSSGGRADAYIKEALSWLPDQTRAAPWSRRDEAPTNSNMDEHGHILLADDNADMREYVRRLLGSRCEVETVGDGVAAIEAIRKRRPDLVLTDVMMPELDGFGLMERIRADPALRDLPVVMLSARAGEETRVEGLAAGADDYLVKPFSGRELVARVENSLNLARLRRGAAKDLRLMDLLHDIGGRCVRDGQDFKGRLEDILRGAMAITGAEIGSIRLVDATSGVLRLVAQEGLDGRFADFFSPIEGACLAADDRGGQPFRRIVIDDVMQNAGLRGTPALRALLDGGIRAGQATPMISSRGEVLGTIATHFKAPHRPGERELAFLDLLVRQAAEYLEREQAGEARARLAAIVESSDDAIVSKDLDGVIQSWNGGAERLFGYTAEEAIGRSITIIIPGDRSSEEPEILARIREGERIDHFETVRRRKDGELLDISLVVSPLRGRHGEIVGAAKIARDITDRKRAERIQAEQ
ncbi:MAG: PAS domain S-box protein, partial [Acetobacteraceae bacterium]